MRKRFAIGITAAFIIALGIGAYFRGIPGVKNVHVSIISGAGGMPPYESPGQPPVVSTGELYTKETKIVFTEPFKSLGSYANAKILHTFTMTNGKINASLPAGKYGLYMISEGQPTLYDKLQLTPYDVQAHPGDRADRGDWFVEVNGMNNTFEFDINRLPS